ncbi:MAG: hypothetical protein LBL46_04510 [Rickettsiales bacterium]|nr:hypothetical protein [Rickettsiales bacterium]
MKKIFSLVLCAFAAIATGVARSDYAAPYGGNSDSNPRSGGQFVQGPSGPVQVGFNPDAARATTTTTEVVTTTATAGPTAQPSDAAASENNLEGNTISIEDQAADEIKARFALSFNKARQACPIVIDKINAIKVSAGINVATGVVGTIGGGTAAVTGFMKDKQDSVKAYGLTAEIKEGGIGYKVSDELEIKVNGGTAIKLATVGEVAEGKITKLAVNDAVVKTLFPEAGLEDSSTEQTRTTKAKVKFVCGANGLEAEVVKGSEGAGYKVSDELEIKVNGGTAIKLATVGEVAEGKITKLAVNDAVVKTLFPEAGLEDSSTEQTRTTKAKVRFACGIVDEHQSDLANKLGTARTIGSFVGGGANVVGAGSVFIGLGQFDEAIKGIELCNSAVAEIEKQATELSFAKPTDSAIGQMKDIVSACKGLDKKNIEDIKGKLTASGVISAVGAVTGITGGVLSMQSNKNTAAGPVESDKAGTASNILAVATTAASLGSTIFSGVSLAGLNKNGEVAEKCKGAFDSNGIRPAYMVQ